MKVRNFSIVENAAFGNTMCKSGNRESALGMKARVQSSVAFWH